MNQGFSVNAPTFVDVGGDGTIDLQQLKVVDGVGSECEQIQVLGTDGIVTDEIYSWLYEADGVEKDGWYDAGWSPIEGVTIKKGQGFIFYCDSGAKLESSGEVVSGETRIPLATGFTVAGNNTNVDRDLQMFKIEDGVGSECEQIQVLGTDGIVTDEIYSWLYAADGVDADGWYDAGWSPIEGVTIKAGQSHIFYADQGATLVVPSQLD